ncbi:uncharacterized protein Z519_10165 [Cladophialophora bantiana CBS 173.52]|uniref:Uncharacterized protein n=1 Tax=Cladophialophora bantiana (strain ATCC 10958 / CBS 173.52 / CDC B-1940 / NIH 8579) TaxID=1442370 RepID=A0A0D2FRU8_CLAB1|nr:uncharacterized protein Z519_10165 [Cladophialophora bantiana CBS 173.52]KIW89312.1 hypothetical protein Z519_10165 [Cladophialophora bantiana CBS 173.52]
MPRPAKPPMTLKEAKRAYKKEGIGGPRYTASQMARADKLDAREEKRKKELEKERQRTENKRKREEKLERDRVVRQKMVEEGRISIEDTWGKVTASQPRLNKFFGRKPALLSTNTIRAEPGSRKEDMQAAEPTTEDQGEQTSLESKQGRLCMHMDEDFTDGIDNETFLMLCATQESFQDDLPTQQHSPTSASRPGIPFRESPPKAQSKGLSESFNSVFNEIEDEDLIALAEVVEAEMATPKQTATIASAPKKTIQMAPPPLRSKAQEGLHKSQTDAKNKTQKPELPSPRPKGKRRLPWDLPRDDFIDLGPSTQALTLELLEEAEAKMRK